MQWCGVNPINSSSWVMPWQHLSKNSHSNYAFSGKFAQVEFLQDKFDRKGCLATYFHSFVHATSQCMYTLWAVKPEIQNRQTVYCPSYHAVNISIISSSSTRTIAGVTSVSFMSKHVFVCMLLVSNWIVLFKCIHNVMFIRYSTYSSLSNKY